MRRSCKKKRESGLRSSVGRALQTGFEVGLLTGDKHSCPSRSIADQWDEERSCLRRIQRPGRCGFTPHSLLLRVGRTNADTSNRRKVYALACRTVNRADLESYKLVPCSLAGPESKLHNAEFAQAIEPHCGITNTTQGPVAQQASRSEDPAEKKIRLRNGGVRQKRQNNPAKSVLVHRFFLHYWSRKQPLHAVFCWRLKIIVQTVLIRIDAPQYRR